MCLSNTIRSFNNLSHSVRTITATRDSLSYINEIYFFEYYAVLVTYQRLSLMPIVKLAIHMTTNVVYHISIYRIWPAISPRAQRGDSVGVGTEMGVTQYFILYTVSKVDFI